MTDAPNDPRALVATLRARASVVQQFALVAETPGEEQEARNDAALLLDAANALAAALERIDGYERTLRADKARLDWLAYDMDNSPLFDALGDYDVHSAAAALWIEEREWSPEEERDCYRRAFRAAIDAARKEGTT